MKQIAQNYKSGALSLLDVPVPTCKPGGVLVRTVYSVISAGTEMMKISESKKSLLGKARARPDQVKKVLDAVRQQGVLATFQKVMNRLDSYTPLGYSLAGVIVEVGAGVEGLRVGQAVACAGNQYALHAEYNWVPEPMCIPIPDGVALDQAAFTTIGAIAMQGLRQADVRLGESACVIGLGLLGQILVRLLRGRVFVSWESTSFPNAAGWRKPRGASTCAVPGSPDFARFLREVAGLTGGHGVDCIFITAGGDSNAPVELAAELARDRARVVDIGKSKLDLPWNAYYEKELDVRFSRSYGPGRYDPLYEEAGIDYPIGYVRWTERRNMECVLEHPSGRSPRSITADQSGVSVRVRRRRLRADEQRKSFGSWNPFQVCGRGPDRTQNRQSPRLPRDEEPGAPRRHRRWKLRVEHAASVSRSPPGRQACRGRHQHRAVRRERGQEVWLRPLRDGQRRPFGGRGHRRGPDRYAPRDACRAGLRGAPRGQGRFCREAARDHARIACPK